MSYAIIKFTNIDKKYYYPATKEIKKNNQVLVNNDQSMEVAEILEIAAKVKDFSINFSNSLEKGRGAIIRKLNDKDIIKINELKKKARGFLKECAEKIQKYRLSMKLLDAELSFDEKKLTFYFGAEGRVDFRQLVQDLAKTHNKIIRLQQVGSRDEARVFGGFGFCGREICCKKFLKNIDSVTLEMAKEQDFSSGISKISGICGKLMCCLTYELEEYRKLKKNLPAIGSSIKTKEGAGRVIQHNVLAQKCRVLLKDDKICEVSI